MSEGETRQSGKRDPNQGRLYLANSKGAVDAQGAPALVNYD